MKNLLFIVFSGLCLSAYTQSNQYFLHDENWMIKGSHINPSYCSEARFFSEGDTVINADTLINIFYYAEGFDAGGDLTEPSFFAKDLDGCITIYHHNTITNTIVDSIIVTMNRLDSIIVEYSPYFPSSAITDIDTVIINNISKKVFTTDQGRVIEGTFGRNMNPYVYGHPTLEAFYNINCYGAFDSLYSVEAIIAVEGVESVESNTSGQCDQFTTSIDELLENIILIYPNPASDFLYLSAGENITASIEIYNSVGEKVLTNRMNQNAWDISTLSPGIYLTRINIDKTVYYNKLIKN